MNGVRVGVAGGGVKASLICEICIEVRFSFVESDYPTYSKDNPLASLPTLG